MTSLAPTKVGYDSSTVVADLNAAVNGVHVGDLVVFNVSGTDASTPTLSVTVGGVSKSYTWTQDLNVFDGGSCRVRQWSTVAVDAGNWVVTASNNASGAGRSVALRVFTHAYGFDSSRVVSSGSQTATSSSNSNPLAITGLSGSSRAVTVVAAVYYSGGLPGPFGGLSYVSGTQFVTPDHGNNSWFFDSSMASPGLYNDTDTSEGSIYFTNSTFGTNSNAHAFGAVIYKTAPPPPPIGISGKGSMIQTGKGSLHNIGNPTRFYGKSTTIFVGKATLNQPATMVRVSGKGSFVTSGGADFAVDHSNVGCVVFAGKGQLRSVKRLSGKGSLVVSGKGTITLQHTKYLSGKGSLVTSGKGLINFSSPVVSSVSSGFFSFM